DPARAAGRRIGATGFSTGASRRPTPGSTSRGANSATTTAVGPAIESNAARQCRFQDAGPGAPSPRSGSTSRRVESEDGGLGQRYQRSTSPANGPSARVAASDRRVAAGIQPAGPTDGACTPGSASGATGGQLQSAGGDGHAERAGTKSARQPGTGPTVAAPGGPG